MGAKVIQVLGQLNDGGAENLVKDYAIKLKNRGYEVVILTIFSKKDTAVYKELKKNNVRMISVYETYGLVNKIRNKICKNHISKFFLKVISEEKPDVLHFHMWILKYFQGQSDKLKGIRMFYTCHSLPQRYFGGDAKDEYIVAKKLISDCSLQLIALHKEMANELNNLFEISNTIVIKNGIDFSRFSKKNIDRNLIREKIGIPTDAYVIGHVGRFSKEKNHYFILKIFKEILMRNNLCYLLLVGNGPTLLDVKNKIVEMKIANKVKILSNRGDVPDLLSAMDVFLFPSIYEGWGNAFIEAQLSDLRCIGNKNLPNEIFCTSKAYKLDLNCPNDWVECALKDDSNAINTSRLSDCDLDKVIEKIIKLYFDN